MTKENLKDWFVGTNRRIAGQLVERHYDYFQVVVTGQIVHANSLEELEERIKNSSLNN